MSTFCDVWKDLSRVPFRGISQQSRQELLLALCALPLAFIDLRLPADPLVTASDASDKGCGICRSGQITPEGRLALAEFERPLQPHAVRIGLVDLFAGIGGLRRSLELLGLAPDVSVISETSDTALRVLLHQWPDSILFPAVQDISLDHVRDLARNSMQVDVWVIGGGFECQPFSAVAAHPFSSSDPRASLCSFIPTFVDFLRRFSLMPKVSNLAKMWPPCRWVRAPLFPTRLPCRVTRCALQGFLPSVALVITGSIGRWLHVPTFRFQRTSVDSVRCIFAFRPQPWTLLSGQRPTGGLLGVLLLSSQLLPRQNRMGARVPSRLGSSVLLRMPSLDGVRMLSVSRPSNTNRALAWFTKAILPPGAFHLSRSASCF